MDKDLRALLFKMTAVICMATGAFGVPVHAQVNPELANCEELRDSAASAQIASCNAHIGCNMVLKLQKTCANANGFLVKLKAMLAGRREITNNDVFDANSPVLMPIPALKSQVAAIQKIARNAAGDPAKGKREIESVTTQQFYYEGELRDGKRHGVGITVYSDGSMDRGQYEAGFLGGQGQSIGTRGIYAGNHRRGGHRFGFGGLQAPDGVVGIGMYGDADIGFMVASTQVGVWDFTKPSGNAYKVLYGPDGKELARGPEAPPGQIAQEPDHPKVVGGSYRP